MRALPLLTLLAACPGPTSPPQEQETSCLDDDRLLSPDGEVSCAASGQLCDPDRAACVAPWRYGSPTFDACTTEPEATAATLAEKAATYQERADALHVHPELGWMMGVTLREGADPATATWEDVERWHAGANDGLWSSLYLASQAFRYAASADDARAAALSNLHLLLRAERERLDLSGVKGNLVRTYVKPGVDGLSCPEGDEPYRLDVEKDDDKWMRVDEAGCLTWLPTEGEDWIVSEVCPGPDFAGWCFRDNTSKDEYAGHVFALGAVLKLVDDPTAQDLAGAILREIVEGFLDTGMRMRDPDGRRTEHGDLSPALGGGFNAAFSLAFVTMAAEHLGDARFREAKDCFTGRLAGPDCPVLDPPYAHPFQDVLHLNAVHMDPQGCLSNDNNASMFLLALVDLLWWETDPALRARYHQVLRDVWEADNLRALENRQNAWYDVIWAAFKDHGSTGDGPAFAAVTEAACGLALFPVDQVRREVPPSDAEPLCLDRLSRPMGAEPRGPHERCLEDFVWWKDQYLLRGCEAQPRVVEAPADYLLPYWMGRSFGFFDPTW